MVPTDEMERMLAAILNGTPKSKSPIKLDKERSELWDALVADVEKMPEGAVVEIGSEASTHDLTSLYSNLHGK